MRLSITILVWFLCQIATTAISSSSYDSVSFSVNTQDTNPYCLEFKPDGSKMFFCGNTNDRIYDYNLGTNWDVSSASAGSSCNVNAQSTNAHGLAFSTNGKKMFVMDNTVAYQYSLSTAWLPSSCSYDTVSLTVPTEDTSMREIAFSSNGKRLYSVGVANDRIYQYNCTSAHSLSSCSYASKYLSVGSQDTLPAGVFFRPDGLKVYMIGGSRIIYQYSLSTAWEIDTGSYDSVSYNASAQGSESATGLAFRETNGAKWYFMDRAGTRTVYQYSSSLNWNGVAADAMFYGADF